MFQEDRVRQAIAEVLEAVGEDPCREGLKDTPRRVAEMYRELLSGLEQDPKAVLKTGFQAGSEDVVIVRDIPFYSLCEHHLLPFFGKAHIGYIPSGWVAGASKLARALEVLAHRPQMQERLTGQLADTLQEALKPHGVAVALAAEHLCMSMRGVRKPGSTIVTTAARGAFDRYGGSSSQFLAFLLGQGNAR